MRKLFALLLAIAVPAAANEVSYHSLQSGTSFGPTPLTDHGLHGEGQIVAVLDTGVDYDNCYFAEADHSAPPINTGTPAGGFAWQNINPGRHKIIAYDFLYSCDQFPGMTACDDPKNPAAYDNQGHGTHAAATALGDRGTPVAHDYGDGLATAAQLIVQDAGVDLNDACTLRPGIGCPVAITPILDQAYKQGARIHSNSWGDRQGTPPPFNPPTANYSAAARDVDAFVYSHPDMLVVFNTGNYGATSAPPPSSLSAPGCAKNTLQVGGTRVPGRDDDTIANYSLVGPTRDGRIKPDLVGPAYVLAGDTDFNSKSNNCDYSYQGGTSWASPSIAGAAALVRQYYTAGYYPSGAPVSSDAFTPSAALLKATLIAGARSVPIAWNGVSNTGGPAQPAPSYQQGFGFPVLHDVLALPGDVRRLRVVDVPLQNGLAQGDTANIRVNVRAGTPLKAVLVWTDPAGVVRGVSDTTPELVNDLDLSVTPALTGPIFGNDSLHPGQPDRLNNVEVVSIPQPAAGVYTINVNAARIGSGPRQSYALVITGDFGSDAPVGRVRSVRH